MKNNDCFVHPKTGNCNIFRQVAVEHPNNSDLLYICAGGLHSSAGETVLSCIPAKQTSEHESSTGAFGLVQRELLLSAVICSSQFLLPVVWYGSKATCISFHCIPLHCNMHVTYVTSQHVTKPLTLY